MPLNCPMVVSWSVEPYANKHFVVGCSVISLLQLIQLNESSSKISVEAPVSTTISISTSLILTLTVGTSTRLCSLR